MGSLYITAIKCTGHKSNELHKNAEEVPIKLLRNYNMIAYATCSKGVTRENFKTLNECVHTFMLKLIIHLK